MTKHRYICSLCNEIFDDKTELTIIDEGTPHRKESCDFCIMRLEGDGELTRCEKCDALFSSRRLKINPKNNVREICPYCGEIWCE